MMIVLLALAAMALNPECNQTSCTRSRNGLQQVVAKAVKPVITPDTRAYVDQARLKHFVLSDYDRLRIRKNTGICTCPGVMSSCGLAMNGEMMLGNAHLVVDEKGISRRPLTACRFQNQAIPPDPPVALVFDAKAETFRIPTAQPKKEGEKDYAVIKLASRVPGADPFAIDRAGAQVRPGQWVMAVSGLQVNLPKGMKQDLSSPIVQECMVTETNYSPAHSGTFGSTCRATDYASGSFNFVRDAQGELQLVGIMQAICDNTLLGKPCNEQGTMVNNIMVRSHMLQDILSLGERSRVGTL